MYSHSVPLTGITESRFPRRASAIPSSGGGRIGKTTCRSALLEGNRYGRRSVGDGTEGRRFRGHGGAFRSLARVWGERNNGGKERARRCSRQARRSVSCCVQVCGVRK